MGLETAMGWVEALEDDWDGIGAHGVLRVCGGVAGAFVEV